MRRAVVWPLVIALAAVGALGLSPLAAQQTTGQESVQAQLDSVRTLLAQAREEFESPRQAHSIAQFDQIIGALESLRQQAPLPPEGSEMLAEAYERQGRAYFNTGLSDKAAQAFRQLVQMRPQHNLDRERVSPKVVDFFLSVKKTLVGQVAVSSKPAGARVSLNGEFVGLTDFFPVEVLAGTYALEITREGYATEKRSVNIAPRAVETVEVTLTRTAATCFFVTQPAGVEIWMDGALRATTGGSPAPDAQEELRAKGLDPAKSSARAAVDGLTLGTHTVELRRRCYESIKTTVEVPDARDYDIEPVRLEDSLATLQLTSDPPGARILLDGELRGVTPMHLEGICSGAHHLEVKHAAGKFLQELVLARNEDLALDCPIRPTLAFLGVIATGTPDARLLAEAEATILENLAKVSSLNVARPGREQLAHLIESEKVTLGELLPSSGTSPEAVRRATERLAAGLEVQGFLIAQLVDERLLRTTTLHLLAAGNSTPDSKDVVFADPAAYRDFLTALDRVIPLQRTWLGLITIDVKGLDGVSVLRVVPGSPAAASVQPGEIVYSADGQPIARTAELLEVVASKKPADKLALHVRGSGGPRTVEIALDATPQEVPLNDSTILYNKLMMDLRQVVEGYPGTPAAALARLNLALCAMHFGDYVSAHEHLLKARAELPTTPGLSQGTALYYLGLALERLNYPQDAAAAYAAAAAARDATVLDNDGLPVSELAARRTAPEGQ